MKRKIRTEKRAVHWYEFLPWLFLAVTLAITYWAWQGEYDSEYAEAERTFEQQVKATSARIIDQFKLFEQSLYSIRKLFDSSEFVSQDEFSQFSTEILHSRFSSGVHDIGYAQYVNFSQPNTYEALDPVFNRSLKQLSDQPQTTYAPAIYAVQHETPAPSSSLFNAFSDEQQKADMESAALRDEILISSGFKVHPPLAPDVVSMILPVYNHKRKQTKMEGGELAGGIRGWVFLNLRLNAVFKSIFGVDANPAIRFYLHDGFHEEPSTLLYQNEVVGSNTPEFNAQYRINEHGENWVLHADSLPEFEKTLNHQHSTLLAILGLLGSFSLTGILFLLISRLRTLESLKRVNRRLKFSDDRWNFAVEATGHGVWDWDIRNKRISFSKSWERMLGFEGGYSDERIVGWRDIVHPDEHRAVVHGYKQALKGHDDHSFECRLQCKNGQWKWVLSRLMIVGRGEREEPVRIIGITTDLSQLKESEEMVWHQANFDSLTGLSNRRMLHSKLDQVVEVAKRKGTKLALLCLDLDNFSVINDAFGPEEGDLMLIEVATRLVSSIYQYEDVARYSGDEFAILISGIAVNELSHLDEIAQNVLAMMAAPFMVAGQEVFISASIGIAVYPNDTGSVNDLSKNADQALSVSNAKGGNCITYFTIEMQEKANKRMRLTNDLRVALRKNELFIEYQPIVELKTEHVYKAEALLRWQHPERGLISPAEFIPIAESTKLINEIGCWVLAESIEQCKVWRQKINTKFQISVNKSPVQFTESSEEDKNCVQLLAEDAQLKNAIVIEITEGLLLDATGQVKATLEDYKDKGIQVALDDFGTGYSSLAYLHKFNIDYLKIDISFVANLETNSDDRVLCHTIIEMAHNLGMAVIAEGVETKAQKDILLNAGCDYGQGYYFSKSLPPAQFESYVKKSSIKKTSVK